MLSINMKFKTQEQQQYCILHTLFFKSDPEPEAMTAVISDTDADEWWPRRFSRGPCTSWPWERATCLPLGTTEEQMRHTSEWGQLNKSKEGPVSSKVWYPSRKWSQSSWSNWLCELTNFREPITPVFMSKCLEKYACIAIFKWTLLSLCWCTCVVMPKTEVTNTTFYYYLN